jgi:hypothetical protein
MLLYLHQQSTQDLMCAVPPLKQWHSRYQALHDLLFTSALTRHVRACALPLFHERQAVHRQCKGVLAPAQGVLLLVGASGGCA